MSLEDLYLAVLLAAHKMEVRLRPELKPGEDFNADRRVAEYVANPGGPTGALNLLIELRTAKTPESLLTSICDTLTIYSWAGISGARPIIEKPAYYSKIDSLPDIQGVATTSDQKRALTRFWLREWQRRGFWLQGMPPTWEGNRITYASGKFNGLNNILNDTQVRKAFDKQWLPKLREWFCSQMAQNNTGSKEYGSHSI